VVERSENYQNSSANPNPPRQGRRNVSETIHSRAPLERMRFHSWFPVMPARAARSTTG